MRACEFYLPIYKALEKVTPLKKDCGVLCDAACCAESDERTGMLLFPYEEKMLENAGFEIEESNCEYGDDKTAKILFCSGSCDRKFRPLACRIFPLMPYKKPGEKMKIIMNPAAVSMCPLARSLKVSDLEPRFVKEVTRAMNRILKLKDGEDYIYMLSEVGDDILKFYAPAAGDIAPLAQ